LDVEEAFFFEDFELKFVRFLLEEFLDSFSPLCVWGLGSLGLGD